MDPASDLSTPLGLSVLGVALLVLANGFFVAVEFAIVRTQITKLRSPEQSTKFGAAAAIRLSSDLELSLSATQLGITIASLILGWWGEHTFSLIFAGWFGWLGGRLGFVATHGAATIASLIIITFLHVVLGELVAKSIGIRYPEQTLRILARPMLLFQELCRPLIWSLTAAANLVLRLFGLTASSETQRVHSMHELAMLITHSTESGVLDKEEEEMLQGVFGFGDTVAREVMTPRADLIIVRPDMSFEDVIRVIRESGFSRFPVSGTSGGDEADDIIGVLLARDLIADIPRYLATGAKDFSVKRIMREPLFIPGTKPIDDLLTEFKRRKVHMAIVLDEHGNVNGAVTLEDLIEEIVGDIFDESDKLERDVVEQDEGSLLVDGGVLVADLNDQYGVGIPEGDYDTVAGFVFASLGQLAKVGDRIVLSGEGIPFVEGAMPINGSTNGESHSDDDEADEDEEGVGPDQRSAHLMEPRVRIAVERTAARRIELVRIEFLKPEPNAAEGEAQAAVESTNGRHESEPEKQPAAAGSK